MPKAPKATRVKNPKDSHLYTDDNPATTLHGTGFKDDAAAKKTLKLIAKRSLTYQFQTVNTMYHRASHHPKRTAAMDKAMDVFKHWLDITYPETKASLRENGFKPVLKKETLEKCLHLLHSGDDKQFAEAYVSMPKGKRIGNVLVDDKEPGGEDWESRRYHVLCEIWPEDAKVDDAFEAGGSRLSEQGLRVVGWGWAPVSDAKVNKVLDTMKKS